MTDLEVVYRSEHPAVLAAIADHRAAMDEWQERAAVLLGDLGFGGRQVFVIAYGLGSRWIAGVEVVDGGTVPSGWRITNRSDMEVLVPDKRLKAGRDAASRIRDCQPPADVRTALPGMPAHHLTAGALLTPELREMAKAVWVRWGSEVPDVDEALWARVNMSQYWAAREMAEALDGAS